MTDRELIQMALDALERFATDETQDGWYAISAVKALRARLAQPEPEPVAWEFAGALFHDRDEVFSWYKRGDVSNIPPLPLYTAPPQREWQGLTDEEIMDACSAVWASHPIEVGRVVEEKLKEKNT